LSFLNKNLSLIDEIVKVSEDAGEIILNIYKESKNKFILKDDNSPLTNADTESNKFIVRELKKLTPQIPVLSEEEKNIPFDIRSSWDEYWLIDPLDGTKEFLKRNGEFTVNIALIRKNTPIFGVVNLPTKGETYWGAKDLGSHVVQKNKTKKIEVATSNSQKIRIVTSRSHIGNEGLIVKKIENYELIKAGSSLKFCLIASGKADAYIRMGPTSEWDIAAGEAIVKFAGGIVVDLTDKNIIYNNGENLLNPFFLVATNRKLADKLLKLINS